MSTESQSVERRLDFTFGRWKVREVSRPTGGQQDQQRDSPSPAASHTDDRHDHHVHHSYIIERRGESCCCSPESPGESLPPLVPNYVVACLTQLLRRHSTIFPSFEPPHFATNRLLALPRGNGRTVQVSTHVDNPAMFSSGKSVSSCVARLVKFREHCDTANAASRNALQHKEDRIDESEEDEQPPSPATPPDTFSCHDLLLSAIALKLKATDTDPYLILGLLSGPRISDRDFEEQQQQQESSSNFAASSLLSDLFHFLGWDFCTVSAVVDDLRPFIEQVAARNRQLNSAGQPSSSLDFSAGYARPKRSSSSSHHAEVGKLHFAVGVALWKQHEDERRRQREGGPSRGKLAMLAAIHFAEAARHTTSLPTPPNPMPPELAGNALLATVTMTSTRTTIDYDAFCQLPGLCLLPLAPLKECNFSELRQLYPTAACVFEAVFVVLLHFKMLGQARKALDVLGGLQPEKPDWSLLQNNKEKVGTDDPPWVRLAKCLRDAVAKTRETPFPRPGFIDEVGAAYFNNGSAYRGEFRDGCPKVAIDLSCAHGTGVTTFTNGSSYDGEWAGGRYEGKGALTYHDGATYDGEWEAGKRNGKALFVDSKGASYDGEFKGDTQHGRGLATLANGGTYNGEWENGDFHGHGERIFMDGTRYQGEWKASKRNGKGLSTFADGGTYDGEWKDDTRHGKGLYTWTADGGTYDGEWKDDTRHGKGLSTYADGSTYEGEWVGDKKHGKGLYTYADGGTYEGEFEKGQFDGHGERIFTGDGSYQGEWKAGKRNGKGLTTYAEGSTYDGEWKDGTQHGKGLSTSPDGDRYDGEWVGNKKHGRGLYTCPDGGTHNGEWKDDTRHGKGITTFVDGSTYDGEWKEDTHDGKGLYCFADGSSYDGEWGNNHLHGSGRLKQKDGTVMEGTFAGGKRHGDFVVTPKTGPATAEVWASGKRVSSRKLPKQASRKK